LDFDKYESIGLVDRLNIPVSATKITGSLPQYFKAMMEDPPSQNMISRLGALILSGGHSRRMGQDKADLSLGEWTMLEHIIHRISPMSSIVVVVGKQAAQVKGRFPKVVFLEDEFPERGPLEGMRVGLRYLQESCQFAWVTPCDCPLVSLPLIQNMVSLAAGYDAVVAEIGSRICGIPAVYRPASVVETIESLLAEQQGSVRGLVSQLKTKWVDEAFVRSIDPQLYSFFNVNTPEDYQRLLSLSLGKRDGLLFD